MNHFRSYRRSSRSRYFKIGIIIIVLLLVINAILLYLFINTRNDNKILLRLFSSNNKELDQIHESLNQKDYQKAFRYVVEAKKRVNGFMVPAPDVTQKPPALSAQVPPASSALATPAGTTTIPPQPVASLPSPDQMAPLPLVFAGTGEYMLICEKESRILYIFRFVDGKFSVVKQYPCIIGANNHAKKLDGDFATPEGVYFFLRFASGNGLPEIYGYGAYVLNYPNFLDHKQGKNGGGIWIHGHSAGKKIGVDIPDTKGCIAVSNDTLKEMSTFLKPNGTPIAIVNKLQFAGLATQRTLSKELQVFLSSWRLSWESINTKRFLGFYASEFVNSEGMGFQAFKQQKEKTNKTKKFIHVTIENLAILFPPEYGGKIAVVRFLQKYHSNNFNSDSKKIFYLKKGQDGWKIVGESSY